MMKALRKVPRPSNSVHTRSPVSFETAHGHALFEALVCEFHWTALQVAAITSCMNASVAENRVWKLRACSNLFPVESPVITAALRAWDEIGLPRDLSASLTKIYRDLSDAKRLALPIARDAGTFAGPNISLLKLQQIAAVWRKLTEDCETALQGLEPEARWRLSGLYTGNSLVLGKFLKEAISGAYDCVNQIGEVAIPVLPQRRKTRRYVLLQPCMIRGRKVNAAVVTRHISSNGMGLDSDQDFELKERVIVELRNGRKIRGTIVWMRNKQVEVQFDETLAASDPLFAR